MTYPYYEPDQQRHGRRQQQSLGLAPSHRTNTLFLTLSTIVLFILAVVFIATYGNAKLAESRALSAGDNKDHHSKAVPPPRITEAEMDQRIKKIINDNPDIDISVTIKDMLRGKQFSYGVEPTVVFEAASVGKLITACALLHAVDTGKLSLGQTIAGGTAQSQLQKMIVDSDNDAWHALNDKLTYDGLEDYAKSIGITSYKSRQNRITSADISLLLEKLYRLELFNKTNSFLLLGYMGKANRTDYIKPAINQPNVKFFHKAGWLDDEDKNHDAAIIDTPNNLYSLVIFTNGHNAAHAVTKQQLMQQIATATADYYIQTK